MLILNANRKTYWEKDTVVWKTTTVITVIQQMLLSVVASSECVIKEQVGRLGILLKDAYR